MAASFWRNTDAASNWRVARRRSGGEVGMKRAPGKRKTPPVGSVLLESGAGNETFTRRVSRCFPNTFFAEVPSEDLNCSLIFRPRQRVRPKKSIDVQRHTLSAPDPHPAHRHPHALELAPHLPLSASPSSSRCRLGSRLPMSGQFGCLRGKAHRASRRPSAQATPEECAPSP